MLWFTEPPLSLYVHIPWCVRKCPYCDFNSHELRGRAPERAYVRALAADLEHELPDVSNRELLSIFIGGGTPSLFSAGAIEALLEAVCARAAVDPRAEVTMEANPGALESGKLAELKAAGINRLSIGVQSFNDAQLAAIGRIHNASEAAEAAECAAATGFDSINLDLMYGLPGQSVEGALQDVRAAVRLGVAHISHYQLTLEPHTPFHHNPPPLPDEDQVWVMQQECQSLLAEHGYSRYEVSAYAREGRQCRHNLNYWSFGDYLGIGAGAHSKISRVGAGEILRQWKLRHPRRYIESAGTQRCVGERKLLSRADAVIEFMMNALRLSNGFPLMMFSRHTGLPLDVVEGAIARGESRGLLQCDGTRVWPTAHGMRFLNDLLQLFLEEAV